MSEFKYTYSVIRYVHDVSVGESLNVGVILHCRQPNFVGIVYDRSVRRLSSAFRDFDASLFRSVMRDLERSIDRMNTQEALFPVADAYDAVRQIWPDYSLNYRGMPAKPGISNKPLELTLEMLFEQLVTRQAPHRPELRSRTDDEVWRRFKHGLSSSAILQKLIPASVHASSVEFKFDHTYQNGKLHVVAPLSFDLLDSDSIRDKAVRWLGNGEVLSSVPELGKFIFVIGRPSQSARKPAFDAAMKWLERVKLDKEIYEEDQFDPLAKTLATMLSMDIGNLSGGNNINAFSS